MKTDVDVTLATASGSTAEDESPPRLATFEPSRERYQAAGELGRGGMGRVVAATDTALARAVAIKQVLSSRPTDLRRFEREALITAQLEHPAIVPIHDVGSDAEGRPFYVMRRIEGEPLDDRLRGANPRERLAVIPNVLAAADAAGYAHSRGIIHRDIKPANILLGTYGETLLIDWGLARRLDEEDAEHDALSPETSLTHAGHVYGTPAYMAPEQARSERVDERADVFALGATLFHVLAGNAPFAQLSAAERTAQAIDQVPAPFEALQIGRAHV